MSEGSNWSDDDKQKVVDSYTDAEPNEENTMDIVKEIAEEMDKSSNSIRMILSRAGVYVKKSAPTKKEGSGTGKRVIKEDALKELTDIIEEVGEEVNEDIIARLTGKAAIYFTGVIKTVVEKSQKTSA